MQFRVVYLNVNLISLPLFNLLWIPTFRHLGWNRPAFIVYVFDVMGCFSCFSRTSRLSLVSETGNCNESYVYWTVHHLDLLNKERPT